jgi:alpha-L-glutamate ligase-like protein
MLNLKQYRQFLTKNERNKVYLRLNSNEGRTTADSKYKTKKMLVKAGVGVPRLIARLRTDEEVDGFNWAGLGGNFVVKPVSGYGGEGILIIRKKINERRYQLMDGRMIEISDVKLHCEEILAGRYSLYGLKDSVLVEERIKIHPMFLSLTRTGTPDVRVVVYNRVPVMAMVRIPTERSQGRANLQQGAIGLGIDMATGISTFGVEGKSGVIKRLMDLKKKKKIKVNGIKIPFWREILETAVKCGQVIKGLGFLAVDVVLDKDRGPMVLEVNARPGLSIQICNKAGLKSRLVRVEDIEIRSIDHAIMLAKYLFGENFFEKVEKKEKGNTIEPIETIEVKIPKGFKPELQKSSVVRTGKHRMVEVRAKIDTGAYRSSIDRELAQKLGLLVPERVLYYRHYRSALGKERERPVIGVTFWLKRRRVTTAVNVANRSRLRTKFLLGRKDLGGFLILAKRN